MDQNNNKKNNDKSWIGDHIDSTKNISSTGKKPNSQKESNWIDDHYTLQTKKSEQVSLSEKGGTIYQGNVFLNKIKLFFAGSKKPVTGKSPDRPKPNKIVIASIISFFIFACIVGYILLPTIVSPANTKNSSLPSLGLSYDFDKDGKLVKVVDTFGYATTFDYDTSDRINKITYPENKWTQISYDKNGKLSSLWTEKGDQLTYKYTPENNGMEVTYPNGKTYKFDQILSKDKIGITYPDGSQLNYNFNADGFPTQITGPDFTKSISYDESNNIQLIKNSNGPSYSLNFDDTDRLTNINDLTGKDMGSWDVTFKTDPMGLIEHLSDPFTTTTYSYDSLHRVDRISTDWGEIVDIEWNSATNKPISLTSPENFIKFDKAGGIEDTFSMSGSRFPVVTSESGQRVQMMTPFMGSTVIENDPLTKIQTVTSPSGMKSFTEWKANEIRMDNPSNNIKIQTNSLGMPERITSPTMDISVAPISSTVISPNNEFQIKYPILPVPSDNLLANRGMRFWNQIPTVIDYSSAPKISRESQLKSDSYWTNRQYMNDPYYRQLADLPESNMNLLFAGDELSNKQFQQKELQNIGKAYGASVLCSFYGMGSPIYSVTKLAGYNVPYTKYVDPVEWGFAGIRNTAIRQAYGTGDTKWAQGLENNMEIFGKVSNGIDAATMVKQIYQESLNLELQIKDTSVTSKTIALPQHLKGTGLYVPQYHLDQDFNGIVTSGASGWGWKSLDKITFTPKVTLNVNDAGQKIGSFVVNRWVSDKIVNFDKPNVYKGDSNLNSGKIPNSIAGGTISPLTQETIKPININSKPFPTITPNGFGGGIGAPDFPSTGGIMLSTENTYVLDKTGKVSTLAEAVLNSPNRQPFTKFQVDYNGTNYNAVELPFGSETSGQVSPTQTNSLNGSTLSSESGMYFDQDRNIFTIRSGSNITSLNCVKYENMFIVAQLGEGKVTEQLPDESMKFSLNDIQDTDYKNLFATNST